MTELEWAEVTREFIKLFETLQKISPADVNLDKIFKVGTILNQEHDRITTRMRADGEQPKFFNASTITLEKYNRKLEKKKEESGMLRGGMTNMSSTGFRGNENLDDYNAKIEKKKQEIHDLDAANFLTLEQKLQASIDKIERERQK